jgi:EAL and modified HD-GYP domain-containing signal transduction protein
MPGSPAGALLPFVTFVKLDVLSLAPDLVARTTARLLSRGLTVIAEKVETADALAAARAAGCTLFQGYHFCKPVNFSGQSLPASHLAQMRLMTALYRPSVSLSAIEDLLKHDASLTYRVLRTVNSAGFGLRREVRSIQEALLLLGLDQVRKWASVWMLAGANRGPSELVTQAVLRGRTSELVGQAFGRPDGGASFFLLGLCSLLDVVLKQPMARLVEALPLEAEIKGALLGEQNEPRQVLDAVMHYTQGDFALAAACAKVLGVGEGVLAAAHAEALRWERELRRAEAPPAHAVR